MLTSALGLAWIYVILSRPQVKLDLFPPRDPSAPPENFWGQGKLAKIGDEVVITLTPRADMAPNVPGVPFQATGAVVRVDVATTDNVTGPIVAYTESPGLLGALMTLGLGSVMKPLKTPTDSVTVLRSAIAHINRGARIGPTAPVA
jgi:hypothetical protein